MNYKNNSINGAIIRPTASELAIEMNDEKWPTIKGIKKKELVNLRYGNFYQQLLPFYEVFGDENMIFLDGTNMGIDSNTLISRYSDNGRAPTSCIFSFEVAGPAFHAVWIKNDLFEFI